MTSHGFALVMCDKDDRESKFPLQLFDLKAHAFTELRVKVGQRLVKQHDFRVGNNGTCQCDALLLTAGEISGILLFHSVEAA